MDCEKPFVVPAVQLAPLSAEQAEEMRKNAVEGVALNPVGLEEVALELRRLVEESSTHS